MSVKKWLQKHSVMDKDLIDLFPKFGVKDPEKDLGKLKPKQWKEIQEKIKKDRAQELKGSAAKQRLDKKFTRIEKLWKAARAAKKSNADKDDKKTSDKPEDYIERLERERLEKERERERLEAEIIQINKQMIEREKATEKQLQQMIEAVINKQIEKKQLYRFTPICLKDTQKHDVIDEKNKDDDILYNKHRNILKQWNINSNKLKKFKWDINDDDDEKKENDKSESGVKLFNKYTNCIPVINEQTNRLTQVTTDDYLLQLINRQNSLSKSVKQDEQKSQSNFSDYNGKKERYETVKQQRIELQREIDTLFNKCNETIQCENTLYKQLKECTIKKEAIDKNIENMKSSSKLCVAVIKSYNDFMENNKKYIDRINTDFKKKWNEFEANWREWNIPDIIVWFKYCTIEMNTQKINWMSVENQLKNRNITGKSLENFNNLVFELIGIHDFNIVTHLGSQIAIILKKYPVNNDKNNQNVIKTAGKQKIPEEYICPITKKIMQDPVMAFDGYTYERSAIESYLKINNKSPVTGDDAEYVVVFPNHKLRAVIQKYIKENNIDVEQEKEGCREGIVETSYL